MIISPAPTGGTAVDAALVLQSTGGVSALWMALLGTCAAVLGTGIALRRRRRSAPAEAVDRSPALPESAPAPLGPSEPSDEEQVVHLLESNGGRMRQTRIVERTDWSKSKVSMLLSEMEADGALHKLRVGRENIISLPGAEPVAARPGTDREP